MANMQLASPMMGCAYVQCGRYRDDFISPPVPGKYAVVWHTSSTCFVTWQALRLISHSCTQPVLLEELVLLSADESPIQVPAATPESGESGPA